MSYIDLRALKNLIHMIEGQAGLQQTLLTFSRNYSFRVKFRMIDYEMLSHIAQRINHRHKRNKYSRRHKRSPLQNKFGNSQLKLFSWVVLLYCHSQKKLLPELLDDDIGKINHIFRRVEPDRIVYEIISFHASKNERSWAQTEIQLFLSLVREKQASEWKTIAYQMFTLSKRQYFRFFEEYREKWINYLNPNLEKGAWTAHQEIKMMTLILEMGHKWSLISKHFAGIRNEHSIKNRYKKIVRSILGAEHCKDKENKAVDEQLLSFLIKKANTEKGSTETAKKEEIDTVKQSAYKIVYPDVRVKQEPKGEEDDNCIVAKQQNDSNGYIFFPPKVQESAVKQQECQLKYRTS